MKAQQIKNINIGSFKSFRWDVSLTNFNDKINIFLGWNGSGKTIISRIFRSFELNEVHEKIAGANFSIMFDHGDKSHDDLSACTDIKVFNEDYTRKILAQSHLDYVIAIGESEVDLSKKENEKLDLQLKYERMKCKNEHDDIAKDVALNVIKPIAGIGHLKKELEEGMYNAYNTPSFIKRIDWIKAEIANDKEKSIANFIKSEEEIDYLRQSLANQSKKQEEYQKLKKWNDWICNIDEHQTNQLDKINKILAFIPTYTESTRISKYQDWSEEEKWIREGVKIHKLKEPQKSFHKCLFCNSEIENKNELLKHFSDDLIILTNTLDNFEKKIEEAIKDITSCTTFYKEEKEKLLMFFDDFSERISKKKDNKLSRQESIEFNNLFIEAEDISDLSNTAWEIETHYVAQKYESYLEKKRLYKECEEAKKILENDLFAVVNELKILKEKSINVHIPKENLNNLLRIAFPYKKIRLDDSEEGIGYILSRDDLNCNLSDLSEGERNFLALAYFLISINTIQQEKQLSEEGIVVIDDPVSSLDSDSLFHIYSIILGEIETNCSRQYFILTHNLDFFGHLLKRFKTESETLDNFYQIKLNNSGSCITTLDDRLSSYNSDYRYAILKLHELQNSTDIDDQIFAANLLRRALETFLHFKYGPGDLASKTQQAYARYTDAFMKVMSSANESTKEAKRIEIIGQREMLYRFINYGSHEFLGIEKIDMSALEHSKCVIKNFFDLIKMIDKEHYESFKIN